MERIEESLSVHVFQFSLQLCIRRIPSPAASPSRETTQSRSIPTPRAISTKTRLMAAAAATEEAPAALRRPAPGAPPPRWRPQSLSGEIQTGKPNLLQWPALDRSLRFCVYFFSTVVPLAIYVSPGSRVAVESAHQPVELPRKLLTDPWD